MFRRRNMPHKPYILVPGKVIGILRSSNHEFSRRQALRRFQKELLQRGLTIRSVGAQVGQIRLVITGTGDRLVELRIDTAVEWRDAARSQKPLKLIQRTT